MIWSMSGFMWIKIVMLQNDFVDGIEVNIKNASPKVYILWGWHVLTGYLKNS